MRYTGKAYLEGGGRKMERGMGWGGGSSQGPFTKIPTRPVADLKYMGPTIFQEGGRLTTHTLPSILLDSCLLCHPRPACPHPYHEHDSCLPTEPTTLASPWPGQASIPGCKPSRHLSPDAVYHGTRLHCVLVSFQFAPIPRIHCLFS